MKKLRNVLTGLMLAVLVLVSTAMPAFAADSTVTYKGGAEHFVVLPGSDKSSTDLFDNFKNMFPGDTRTEQIKVINDKDKNTDLKIYMRCVGAEAGSQDFLSKLNISVKAKGGSSALYEGPADGKFPASDWVFLGTAHYRADKTLNVTLEMPIELGNEYASQTGIVDWQFKVEEVPVKVPGTGDESNIGMYVILMLAALVIVIVVLIMLKRKKDGSQNEDDTDDTDGSTQL